MPADSATTPVRRGATRRVVRLGVGTVLIATLATVAPVRAVEPDPAATLAATEARMVELLSADRQAAGLVPYRGDPRLTALARERATELATTGHLSHVTATGGSVFDLLTVRGITWFAAGEAIAWNDVADGRASAEMTLAGWIASSPHRAILRATDLNYAGVGVAFAPDRSAWYWALLAIRQADRTGAVAGLGSVVRTTGTVPAGYVRVAVSWSGRDVPLQVLTAGLQDFQVQRRANGGAWRTIIGSTTATRLSQSLARGVRYEYRVRARDRRGNYGQWTPAKGIAA